MCKRYSKKTRNAARVLAAVAFAAALRMQAQTVNTLSPATFTMPLVHSSFPGTEQLVKSTGGALTDIQSPAGGGSGTQIVGGITNEVGVSGSSEVEPLNASAGMGGGVSGGGRSRSSGILGGGQTSYGIRSSQGAAVRYGISGQSIMAKGGSSTSMSMEETLALAPAAYVGGSGHPFATHTMDSARGMSGRAFDNPPMPNLNMDAAGGGRDDGLKPRVQVYALIKKERTLTPPIGADPGTASTQANRELARGRNLKSKGVQEALPQSAVPKVGIEDARRMKQP